MAFSAISYVFPFHFPLKDFRVCSCQPCVYRTCGVPRGCFLFIPPETGMITSRKAEKLITFSKQGDTISAEIVGPENPFLKDNGILKAPFRITVCDEASAYIKLGGRRFNLEKGKYTDWIKVGFKAAPGIKVHGICKFLLQSTSPEFELYVTPVNIDPEKPAMPIAHPAVYSTYFAKCHGPYATLGLAEDTWALNEKVLNDDRFLQQCIQIDEEREKMFLDSLDKVRRGLCVCVFDGTDRIQHTFWRYLDKNHPGHKGQGEKHHQRPNAIEDVYARMDALVGKTLDKCEKNDKTIFMVISDHGFASFRYGIDLNRWLEENGYLSVKDGERDQKYLSGINWSQTSAFAIGLAGIYLNIKGREAQGIVDSGDEVNRLREALTEKLTGLRHSSEDQPAIRRIYNASKIYHGPYKNEAPDLIVGYHQGYRASWETAIGQVTETIFHVNRKAWSGDHCIDSSLVPGVLFCNRPISTENPRIIDIGPTVLDMFGVDVPGSMDGKPLAVSDHDMIE